MLYWIHADILLCAMSVPQYFSKPAWNARFVLFHICLKAGLHLFPYGQRQILTKFNHHQKFVNSPNGHQ